MDLQRRSARPGCTHAWSGEGRGLHRQGQEEAIALDDGLEKGTAAEGEEGEDTLVDALCALWRGFWQIMILLGPAQMANAGCFQEY